MSWIPENPGIIPLLGSLSAAFGAVASALGSLGRFSRAAKARRTIDWINNTLDQNNDGDGRQHALKELRASHNRYPVCALVEIYVASPLDDSDWVPPSLCYRARKIFRPSENCHLVLPRVLLVVCLAVHWQLFRTDTDCRASQNGPTHRTTHSTVAHGK